MSIGPKSKLLTLIGELQQPDYLSLPKTAEGQVGNRKYSYLTIGKLHEVVFPKLQEKGLSWIACPSHIEGTPALHWELSHIESGECISGEFPLCLANIDPQGLGSAITYARRYALLSVLGLVGDDDDDGAAGGAQSNSEAPRTERPAVPAIPLDRAKKILTQAQEVGLAEDTELKPALVAKLTEVGVETGRLGHLNVDQAEQIEAFIIKEAS